MKRVNLIPTSRIDAKRRAAHSRRCIAGCVIYTTIVLVAGIACRFAWGDGRKAAEARLAGADSVIEHSTTTLAKVRAELATENATLTVNHQLTAQPDWSLLLKMLAAENGDSIILKSCALNTRAEAAPPAVAPVIQTISAGAKTSKTPAPAPLPRAVLLTLTGAGDSQLAVSEFVVRLEKTGLFRRVGVLETGRDTVPGGETFSFKLECEMNRGKK